MMTIKPSKSWWSHVETGPPDVMLRIGDAFAEDKSEKKVNLSVGAYRDENGRPWILPSVRQAIKKLDSKDLDKEYLPITGYADFCLNSVKLALDEHSDLLADGRVAMVQTVSGIGALRVWFEFADKFYLGKREVWMSDPSYGHHEPLVQHLGYTVKKHRYYDRRTKKSLDYEGFLEDISNIPEGSIILLHPCGHNPAGVDPSPEQWAGISKAIKRRNILPLIDMAHVGITSGDLDYDAYPVRLFARDGHQFVLTQTYSKNMGLYAERVGCLSLVTASAEEAARVTSQLKIIMRHMYSNPPANGARIVNEVLTDPELKRQWIEDLNRMKDRLALARKVLKAELDKTGSKLNWDHVTDQIGMFCYTGMTPDQVKRLRDEHNVYASTDGRMSMSGITSENVERVARGIHEVTEDHGKKGCSNGTA